MMLDAPNRKNVAQHDPQYNINLICDFNVNVFPTKEKLFEKYSMVRGVKVAYDRITLNSYLRNPFQKLEG